MSEHLDAYCIDIRTCPGFQLVVFAAWLNLAFIFSMDSLSNPNFTMFSIVCNISTMLSSAEAILPVTAVLVKGWVLVRDGSLLRLHTHLLLLERFEYGDKDLAKRWRYIDFLFYVRKSIQREDVTQGSHGDE